MPGDVVTVTSGKGGVGKTTTAVNLAVALRQRGHSVAVLDADLGMPNVEGFVDVDAERTLHDVLAGEADVDDALVELAEGLAVLVGDRALDGFAAADPAGLDAVVETLADRYRYVLVDTGGGLSYEGVLPLELGDEVVLVTSPDPAAVGDTAKSKRLADRLGVPVRGVVVTRADGNAGDDPEGVARRLGVDLLGTVPGEAVVAESTAEGIPVAAHAPDSGAAVAYDRIAATVANDAESTLEPLDSRARAPGDPLPDPDPEGDAGEADDADAPPVDAGGAEGPVQATDGGSAASAPDDGATGESAPDAASESDPGSEEPDANVGEGEAEDGSKDESQDESEADAESESEVDAPESGVEEASGGLFSRLRRRFG